MNYNIIRCNASRFSLRLSARLLSVLVSAVLLPAALSAKSSKQELLPYRNASLPIEQRVSDLLQRMTLEEKVGQLRCPLGWFYYDRTGNKVAPSSRFVPEVVQPHIGMLWATLRADPWTQKTLDNGLNPQLAAKACNALQRDYLKRSRLYIPLFFAEEAPHGHMAIGATTFPTGIGVAATWQPELAREMGEVIGKEIRLQGAHISYGPVLDLARDARWSRVEETMGEDPYLSGRMGAAEVEGLGAGHLDKPYATLATLKHFIGYGTTEGGQNGNQSVLGERDLRQNFLRPFRDAVKAGALSVMTSYNSIDGVPSSGNGELYNGVLRRDWRFKGFVVSDLYSIDGIYETHHVAATLQDAAVMAMQAGVDVDLGGKAYATLADAARKGMIDTALIDEACRRVLTMKMEMGLFEHPFVDEQAARAVHDAQSRAVALRVAEASVTLLKNNGVLPLAEGKKVAVVGPNADNVYNMLGDYTAPQAEGKVTTLLQGVRALVGAANVVYAKGCAVRDTTGSDIATAVEAARRADAVIVAVGGSSARDFKTNYKETGAAETNSAAVSDMDCGEGFDRSTLTLLGDQLKLLRALKATGKPLIVVYIEGRPLNMNWAKANADALLCAYYPGEAGGEALANVIYGKVNPAGRLPFSVPASEGQLPVYYNKRVPLPHNYVEGPALPAYAFGAGMSYTTFRYADMRVEPRGSHRYAVSLDVTNTGSRDGDEVVQLYLRHLCSSVSQPSMQLCAFKRLSLKAGETRRVELTVDADDLSIVNRRMLKVVESGDVEFMAGAASDDIRLRATVFVN